MNFTYLKVGFATLLGLVILFGGTLWVKNYNPAARKLNLTIEFPDGRLIAGGDPVQMAGIKIGEVRSVSLSDSNTALVTCFITYRPLSPDASFTIVDVGLMGDKALVITQGKAPGELDATQVLRGVSPIDLSQLITDAATVMQRLNRISGEFERNLDVARLSEEFSRTLENLNTAVDAYTTIADDNREPLKRTVKNLDAASLTLNEAATARSADLAQAIAGFRGTTDKLSLFLDDLSGLSAVADTLASTVGSGRGSLSRFISSEDLYNELRTTNASIDSFVTDFRRNPGKYTDKMNFKIRLF